MIDAKSGRGSITMTLEEFDNRLNRPFPVPDGRLQQLQIGPAISMYRDEYRECLLSPLAQLLMRLGWGPFSDVYGVAPPVGFLGVHPQGDKMLVFVAGGGGHAVMEDDKALYPSDSLITRLRMLAEAYKKGSGSGI